MKHDYDIKIGHGPETVFDLSQGRIFCGRRPPFYEIKT
jgi:hypothetical protein